MLPRVVRQTKTITGVRLNLRYANRVLLHVLSNLKRYITGHRVQNSNKTRHTSNTIHIQVVSAHTVGPNRNSVHLNGRVINVLNTVAALSRHNATVALRRTINNNLRVLLVTGRHVNRRFNLKGIQDRSHNRQRRLTNRNHGNVIASRVNAKDNRRGQIRRSIHNIVRNRSFDSSISSIDNERRTSFRHSQQGVLGRRISLINRGIQFNILGKARTNNILYNRHNSNTRTRRTTNRRNLRVNLRTNATKQIKTKSHRGDKGYEYYGLYRDIRSG